MKLSYAAVTDGTATGDPRRCLLNKSGAKNGSKPCFKSAVQVSQVNNMKRASSTGCLDQLLANMRRFAVGILFIYVLCGSVHSKVSAVSIDQLKEIENSNISGNEKNSENIAEAKTVNLVRTGPIKSHASKPSFLETVVADDGTPDEPQPPNPDPDDLDSSVAGFDCQDLSNMAPGMIEGSTLAWAKNKCDQGDISTSDQVAEALNQYEGPNPSLDDQITIMATQICEKAMLMDSELMNETKSACTENPRNDEHVVDVVAKLQDQLSPTNTTEDSIDLASMCTNLNKNRKEIDDGIAVLASRSSSNQRRLNDSNETKITSFDIATALLEMLDCYCDTDNPDNEGCIKKQLQFAEATMQSVVENAADDFGGNPENVLSKLESSLEKHTSHLRQQSGFDKSSENDLHAGVERALVEVGVERCDPPGVQVTHTGYSICLYAGPAFECEVSWDVRNAGCLPFSCGGGTYVQLQAEANFCASAEPSLELELKICVAVISDILDVLGYLVPEVENVLNSFNIYGGCYRLAYAHYDILNQRFMVTSGPHDHSLFHFQCSIGGKAYMRFKGSDWNYHDDLTWATYEYLAASNNQGQINNFPTKLSQAEQEARLTIENESRNFMIEQWAVFEVSFSLRLGWDFGISDILPIDLPDVWSVAAHFLSGGSVEGLVQVDSLQDGDLVYLYQPDHSAYLGMCGVETRCSGNRHGVYGYRSRPSRTRWQVEKSGNDFYFYQPLHGTYLGMCGVERCAGSSHGVYGFPGTPSRTKWRVEQSGGYFYMRNVDHGTYLGMCGVESCAGSSNGVYGFSGTPSRTAWIVEQAYRDPSEDTIVLDHTFYFKNVDHNSYLGLCGVKTGCSTSRHYSYGYLEKQSRTRWQLEVSGGNYYVRNIDHGTYLGMCGVESCAGSNNGVYGFFGKPTRTKWEIQQSGNYIYLYQPLHNAYAGVCGVENDCSGNSHGVYSYAARESRTRWIMEQE